MKTPRASAALVAACLAGSASAQAPAPLSPRDVTVHMVRGLKRYYPDLAWRLGVEGRAVAKCKVATSGDLTNCAIEAEEPAGCGFAETLLKTASAMRLPPRAKDGTPTAGRTFRLDFGYRLPPGVKTGATSCAP